MSHFVYTIGHSTHSTERLLNLLVSHRITAVADIRSQPYSRTNPQFNRETLQADLKAAEIAYVFLGRELGARTEDPSCYVRGKVQYDRLARTGLFLQGIQRILTGMSTHQIALLCAEKDPLVCHRAILVGRHLVTQGVTLMHILETGELESHDSAVARLLRQFGMPETDLLRSHTEIVAEAFARRANEIAYVLPLRSQEGTLKEQDS